MRSGALPDDIAEVTIEVGNEGMALANVVKSAGLTASTSDAHRMVKQGAVKIDGERVSDSRQTMTAGVEFVLQVGKRRFARVNLS